MYRREQFVLTGAEAFFGFLSPGFGVRRKSFCHPVVSSPQLELLALPGGCSRRYDDLFGNIYCFIARQFGIARCIGWFIEDARPLQGGMLPCTD